jgi:CheY-like chemotaxis protein
VVNLRGQIIQVLDLPSITGCKPQTGLNIMLVTEFARTTQAFAVESWDQLNAIAASAEAEGKTVYDKVAMVVTDLEMPEMDGFTLTRNVKKSGRFANLPVVIHSSLSGTTNEENVRSVGADGYVAKFSPEDLAGTIRRVLHR